MSDGRMRAEPNAKSEGGGRAVKADGVRVKRAADEIAAADSGLPTSDVRKPMSGALWPSAGRPH